MSNGVDDTDGDDDYTYDDAAAAADDDATIDDYDDDDDDDDADDDYDDDDDDGRRWQRSCITRRVGYQSFQQPTFQTITRNKQQHVIWTSDKQ